MITTPTIYSDNESQVCSDLSIPQRRTTIWLNWFTSILKPQQWLNDLVFTKYYGGSSASVWDNTGTILYTYGQDVIYVDNCVYECINTAGIMSATAPNVDTTNWIKILDTFVGVAERIKYTGQKSFLEYLLNKYFMIGTVNLPWFGSQPWVNNIEYQLNQVVYYSGSLYTCILNTTANQVPTDATYWALNPQIFIVRNTVNNNEFWMASTPEGSPQSYMPIDTRFAASWMPVSATTFQNNSFTIYVPVAVANAINTSITAVVPGSLDTYITLITSIVSNYVRAGKSFNVTTY